MVDNRSSAAIMLSASVLPTHMRLRRAIVPRLAGRAELVPPADLLRLSQLRLIFLVPLLWGIARRLSGLPVLRARLFHTLRSVAMHALGRRAHLGSPLMVLRRPLPIAVIIFAPAVAAVVIVAFMAIVIAPMPVIIIAVVIIRTPIRAVIVTRRPPGVVIAAIGVISVAAIV